jgi:hypothetical protein
MFLVDGFEPYYTGADDTDFNFQGALYLKSEELCRFALLYEFPYQLWLSAIIPTKSGIYDLDNITFNEMAHLGLESLMKLYLQTKIDDVNMNSSHIMEAIVILDCPELMKMFLTRFGDDITSKIVNLLIVKNATKILNYLFGEK